MNKPTVTELIGLLDKPALLEWANKQGLQGVSLKAFREKAFEAGSNLHKQIENYCKLQLLPSNLEFSEKIVTFFQDKEIVSVEENIETEFFKGRLDLKYKFNNKIYLVDFKKNQTNLYLENKLQLTAYAMATESDKLAIISLPDFKVLELEIKDFTPYIEILKALSTIYKYKTQINHE